MSDLTKHGQSRIGCGRGRAHVFNTGRLSRYAMLRNWNGQLQTRLRCGACGRPPDHLKATPEKATPSDPSPRDG